MKINSKKQLDEIQLYKDKYLRALADYQNLEKRILSIKEENKISTMVNLVSEILPFIDTIEKIAQHEKSKNIEMAINQIQTIFNKLRVKKIESLNKEFDPNLMECIEVIPSDKDSLVLEESLSGYMFEDRVIRHSKVKVSKIIKE